MDDLSRPPQDGTMRANIFSVKGRGTGSEEYNNRRAACSGRKGRGVLTVDCRECRHSQDLTDQNCLKGVLRLMAADPHGVHEVMLCRDWEIVYGHECVSVLDGLTEVIRFCNGLSFQQAFDDCPSCPSNHRSAISRIIEALPQAAPELEPFHHSPPGVHGRACEQCVRNLRSNLDHARSLLDQAEELVNRTAYRVVPQHEH